MTYYVIEVELDTPFTEDTVDGILDELHDWHAVAIGHQSGNLCATLTLPAGDLVEAAGKAYKRLRVVHGVVTLSVMDEDTRDRREGFAVADAG